jgi:hypothetical protein
MKTWVKLYTEMLNDLKMSKLTLAERGLWCLLIAMAGQVDNRDADDQPTGLLGTRADIAWCLRLAPADMEPMLQTLMGCGLLTNHEDQVTVRNYAKRQAIPESSKHDATAARQRQWYANHKPNEVITPLCSQPNEIITPTPNEIEQNRAEQNRAEERESGSARTQAEPLKPQERPPPIVAFFDEFAFIPAPNGAHWKAICAAATDVDRWREAIRAWHLCGNSTRNVQGMLDWYTTGKRDNRVNRARDAPPSEAEQAAQRETEAAKLRAKSKAWLEQKAAEWEALENERQERDRKRAAAQPVG